MMGLVWTHLVNGVYLRGCNGVRWLGNRARCAIQKATAARDPPPLSPPPCRRVSATRRDGMGEGSRTATMSGVVISISIVIVPHPLPLSLVELARLGLAGGILEKRGRENLS